ncbi:glyoxalase [Candidatus Saccharibacteria bacterium RIFCSPLOWO2_01_FULL_49_22]|nr:MAG: glyoxalase [Candidatus Saccharibacteria bacterium RIFCSPLOWO2_01_FULL_49_22]
MLGDKECYATLAVKDVQKAKSFYEGTLGLTSAGGSDDGGLMYKCGSSHLFVYPSEFAGTNKATAASWVVGDDLDKVIADLKSKGVAFEQYDMPNVTRKGDVHVMGELRAAWFKDPDGNILNLVNGM